MPGPTTKLASPALAATDVLCARRFRLFMQRKPGLQNQWNDKLPDFVKRLEGALFQAAKSQVGSAFAVHAISLPRTHRC